MARHENLSVGNLEVDNITGGGSVVPIQGTKFYLDPTNGSDGNDGKSPTHAFKTLPTAYAALTAGKNDILYYLAGTSSISLSAAFTWAKSYTHFIGVCAPTSIGQRARIFAAAGSTFTPMITVSGSGCILKNLYFFHGVDSAAALVGTSVTGGRNYFENVHFAGMGHATQAAEATAATLLLTGSSCEENTFKNCTIGVDTVAREAANAELRLASAATRNVFDNCTFLSFAGSSGAGHLWVDANTSGAIDRFVRFKDCTFLNATLSTATAMTYGMAIHASVGGTVLMDNLLFYGASDLQNNNANCIVGRTPVFDAADAGLAAAQTAS